MHWACPMCRADWWTYSYITLPTPFHFRFRILNWYYYNWARFVQNCTTFFTFCARSLPYITKEKVNETIAPEIGLKICTWFALNCACIFSKSHGQYPSYFQVPWPMYRGAFPYSFIMPSYFLHTFYICGASQKNTAPCRKPNFLFFAVSLEERVQK